MQYSDKGDRMVSSCSLQHWIWFWTKRNTDMSTDRKEITSAVAWADSLLFWQQKFLAVKVICLG
jgi:hypothetical protein